MSTYTTATDTALANERNASDKTISDQQATIDDLQAELAALKAPTAAKIGASLPLNNLYGNTVEIARIFLQDDSAISLTGIPQSASVVVSRKTRGAWFGTRLADAQKARPDVKLYGVCDIHEPEDDVKRALAANPTNPDYTIAIHKARCREDVPIIKGAGATAIQVLMGGSVNDGTASKFWEPAVDQIWYDVYHGGAGKTPDSYKAPATWLKPYFDAAMQAGKPMGFAEFGSRPSVADNDNYAAPAYLQWVRDNSGYCRQHPTLLAAAWFNFGKARIRFQNQAMADAWLK